MQELEVEAKRRKVELLILPTAKAVEALNRASGKAKAILHVTC